MIMKHPMAWFCWISLAGAAGLAAAEERAVYRSTGEHGEVVFSDVAAEDAERVVVETSAPADDPLAELDRRIEQTLIVADSLEASRLAREQARAEARARAQARAAEARAALAPEVVYQDRYVQSPYLYPRTDGRWRHRDRDHGRPPHKPPHKPPHGQPEEPEVPRQRTISKAFPPLD